jgi:hypothetical protein
MSPKSDLRLLIKSAEDLAYALRDTLDVLADHEQRIKVIEEMLGKPSLQHAPSEIVALRRTQK